MIKRSLLVLLVTLLLPAAAQAATLTLGGPSAATVGQIFSVPVLLNTTESANAVAATITYPTDLLTLQSVSKTGSIITLWPSDPETGNATVNFGGIVLNPGWSGTRGTVVTLVFAAKAVGTAVIEFESDASVLANDGNATPILSGTLPSSVYISAATAGAPALPSKTLEKPAVPAKTATSTATTTPALANTTPTPATTAQPEPAPPTKASLAMFVLSPAFMYLLGAVLLLLVLFLAWHRYERGVPPFYFAFEGKTPMTPPTPEELLKQFETLREAITLEALSIEKVKEGQPLTPEEEKFLTLFKKLMNVVEGS